MNHRGLYFFLAGFVSIFFLGWFLFPYLLYEKIDQPMQFSHITHTEMTGMMCIDCHSVGPDGRFSGIPTIDNCIMCHMEPIGDTKDELILVEEFIKPNREIPWLVYARQPENVYFPHVQHITLGEISCESCHGDHGTTTGLRPFERNRISGYSRDIWGASISRFRKNSVVSMKMIDCINCHENIELQLGCIGCHK